MGYWNKDHRLSPGTIVLSEALDGVLDATQVSTFWLGHILWQMFSQISVRHGIVQL
jgi:hypothetical protein